MVLKPQTLRNWKLFTGFATAATAFHTVFRVDYGPHDHCFTGAQGWYNKKVDAFLGIRSSNTEILPPEVGAAAMGGIGENETVRDRPRSPVNESTAQ